MLIESLQGRYPSYFVYGPLVFSAVTREFCAAIDRSAARCPRPWRSWAARW